MLVQKIPLEISFPSGDSRLKISFRFLSSLFLISLAQSQQISSFDFVETNMFDMRDKSTFRDFVARSFTSRTKNHDSLAKTFSPGIIVRSTCGKSSAIPSLDTLKSLPIIPHLHLLQPRPSRSCDAEKFNFRLIRYHSIARNSGIKGKHIRKKDSTEEYHVVVCYPLSAITNNKTNRGSELSFTAG